MKTEAEILESLEMVPEDMVIACGENEYIPMGYIAKTAADHIRFLREQINTLEAWRYGS